ncbi:PhoH family protein [Wenzhouxiangella marina]|uniref:PhoH-like protein n=1 Tax=Wenzhouxiangella marina TaxID=1579979 RepID=A0A0K0XW54_9GAMM|nr:PhoH family protein [Wenzhouxiangella marina]AKS41846.1 PhoH family protein [Wenzhouxiangella marina]MBB6086389.1 phosphate starvation-inducible PhoH-like protein [Wenzhouxiangella marina]
MSKPASAITLELEPADNERLANLCGHLDDHLRLLEKRLGVSIAGRGNVFSIEGEADAVQAGRRVLRKLYRQTEREVLTPALVNLQLQQSGLDEQESEAESEIAIRTRRGLIRGRGPNQKRYLERIASCDVNFGVGPAGTGKTFLAVACAVDALESDRVQRIVLVRPAVEAGERLGFLPGDLAQKVDPYLRPLHDALYEMLGFEQAARLSERNVIEVAPLAYMRGRTLNDAFVILDEAQNTTSEQMKMFLTRIGFGSKAVITGDMTQIDLPANVTSGLRQAIGLLKDIEGVSQTFFDSRDVVRHPIVRRIVEAYERADELKDERRNER